MTTAADALADLIERSQGAADSLYRLAREAIGTRSQRRLEGKREGVLLVKGYAEEALRLLGGEPS